MSYSIGYIINKLSRNGFSIESQTSSTPVGSSYTVRPEAHYVKWEDIYVQDIVGCLINARETINSLEDENLKLKRELRFLEVPSLGASALNPSQKHFEDLNSENLSLKSKITELEDKIDSHTDINSILSDKVMVLESLVSLSEVDLEDSRKRGELSEKRLSVCLEINRSLKERVEVLEFSNSLLSANLKNSQVCIGDLEQIIQDIKDILI